MKYTLTWIFLVIALMGISLGIGFAHGVPVTAVVGHQHQLGLAQPAALLPVPYWQALASPSPSIFTATNQTLIFNTMRVSIARREPWLARGQVTQVTSATPYIY